MRFKFLINFFQVCGIAPINIEVSRDNHHYSFTTSSKNVAYNILLISCIFLINGLSWYFRVTLEAYIVLKYNAGIVFVIFGSVTVISVFCVKRAKQIRILSDINRIRENLNEDDDDRNVNIIFERIKIIFFMYAFCWIGLSMTLFWFEIYISLITLVLNMNYFILSTVAVQYCFIVIFMQYLFAKINENLLYTLKYVDNCNAILAIDVNRDLTRLWNQYAELSKVSRCLSNFYSFNILLVIIEVFCNSVSVSYLITKPIVLGGNMLLNTHQFINGIFFLAAILSPLSFLMTSVANTIDEVRIIYGKKKYLVAIE